MNIFWRLIPKQTSNNGDCEWNDDFEKELINSIKRFWSYIDKSLITGYYDVLGCKERNTWKEKKLRITNRAEYYLFVNQSIILIAFLFGFIVIFCVWWSSYNIRFNFSSFFLKYVCLQKRIQRFTDTITINFRLWAIAINLSTRCVRHIHKLFSAISSISGISAIFELNSLYLWINFPFDATIWNKINSEACWKHKQSWFTLSD